MTKLLNSLLIEEVHGIPFKPSTQGSVERVNGTIKANIAKLSLYFQTQNWYTLSQIATKNYNNSIHRVMKKTPTQILFNLAIPSEQFDTIANDNLKEVMSNSPFSSQKLNYDKTLFETIHNSSVQPNPNTTCEKNITGDIIDVYLQKQSETMIQHLLLTKYSTMSLDMTLILLNSLHYQLVNNNNFFMLYKPLMTSQMTFYSYGPQRQI